MEKIRMKTRIFLRTTMIVTLMSNRVLFPNIYMFL